MSKLEKPLKNGKEIEEFADSGRLSQSQVNQLLNEASEEEREAKRVEETLELTSEERRYVELGLIISGESVVGFPDETFDERTREALENWQRSKGEEATGYLTVGQSRELIEAGSSVQPVTFIRVSAGGFLMGSPESEAGRNSNEGPQHRVTLTRSFEIQRTEVTQWHWVSQMGENPSYFDKSSHCPDEHVILQGTAIFVRIILWR